MLATAGIQVASEAKAMAPKAGARHTPSRVAPHLGQRHRVPMDHRSGNSALGPLFRKGRAWRFGMHLGRIRAYAVLPAVSYTKPAHSP